MLDHDARSQEMIAQVFEGKTEELSRDNITLYWLTIFRSEFLASAHSDLETPR